jgi:magnesium transporter
MTVSAVVADGEDVTRYDDPIAARDTPGTAWVRVAEGTDEEIAQVADAFDVHPLAIDDLDGDVRPKTESFGSHTFVLFETAELTTEETTSTEEIGTDPVGFFVGDDWLVTLSRAPSRPTDTVWRAVANGDSRPLVRGPDFLAYRVIDTIVDGYYEVLDAIEADVERVEERVVAAPDAGTIEMMNEVRRDLLSFRRALWPARAAIGALVRGDSPHVREATERHYRGVYEHVAHLVDLVETYRDLVRGARDTYQNTLSQSTNDVMKTLTVVAAIVLPLTLVAGVYGMNFRVMPELGGTYGYPAVLVGIALLATLLVVYFERRDYV